MGEHIGPEACRFLAQILRQGVCPRLKHLNLGWNQVKRLGGDALVDTFSKTGSSLVLEILDLKMNHIPPETIVGLGKAMLRGSLLFLAVLDLRQNLIGSEGAKAIAHTVLAGGFKKLKELYVQENQ